jgi:hypothetical protein
LEFSSKGTICESRCSNVKGLRALLNGGNAMKARLLASSILALALTQGVALAQNAPNENVDKPNASVNANTNAQSSQSAQTLPQQISQKLQKQGFKDVKVVPGSFLVSAKDQDGDPVTMVIGPHSMTMFTTANANESSNNANNENTSASNGSSAGTGSGKE